MDCHSFLNQTLIQKKILKKSFQDGKLPTSPTFWELLQKQSQKKSKKVVEGVILILEISSMTYWKLLKICPNVMWFTENHLMLSIQKNINWMECPHTWAPSLQSLTGKLQGRITTQGDPCNHYREWVYRVQLSSTPVVFIDSFLYTLQELEQQFLCY